MLFKLHYFFMAAGANALGILLGVYLAEYTDATPAEIGLLYMLMPFVGMTFRPIICSYADRKQAHRKYLILCELLIAISFLPFVILPYLGPGVHVAHPRFSWYFLVSFKIMGDIAFGGATSIGDSLAINYATRIGTAFSTYRIWATISFMMFGFITGHLNEIWFLPKYAAGFMILILVSLLDALVCYLWPGEYFVMITASKMEEERERNQLRLKQQQQQQQSGGEKKTWSSTQTKSLMPRQVVWAHAKRQLWSLVTMILCIRPAQGPTQDEIAAAAAIDNDKKRYALSEDSLERQMNRDNGEIDRRVQLQTLFVLVRRDPRILLYLLTFVGAGAVHMPMSFFFMSLSERCATQQTCNFSVLGGYAQISMAAVETLLFVHVKTIIRIMGRLNTLSLAFLLALVKFLFYATIWSEVDPHWALVSEMSSGIVYGTFLTVQVEVGHLFSNEVEHLIPELVQRKVINQNDEQSCEALKLSLSATMQALIASAFDGLGRGLCAFVSGLIIGAYSYETLWVVIVALALFAITGLQMASMFEHCTQIALGLDHAENLGNKKQHDDRGGSDLESGEAEPKAAPKLTS